MGPCCNSDSQNEEESRGRAELNANKIVLQRKEKPGDAADRQKKLSII